MLLPDDFNPDFPGLKESLASTPPSVAIRLNSRKNVLSDSVQRDSVPWCPTGRYLESRPDFTFDPAMHQGLYYVQDASSMIYHHITRRLAAGFDRPVAILDACAAPGGKTTAIIDALPDGSLIVANEYVPARAEVLHENLVKWGYPDAIVSRGDTSRFRRLEGMFDIIAADVPCSGEGMFRKDPEAVAQWSPRLVSDCATLQREIIGNLWPALAPGGFLIYSTCTFNRQENEDNIAWFINRLPGAQLEEIDIDPSWNLTRRDGTLHFLPGDIRGEGLTVALLRKSENTETARCRLKKNRATPAKTKIPPAISTWIHSDNHILKASDDRIHAIPRQWVSQIEALEQTLALPWGTGVEIATTKGKDIIPSHALALNTIMRRDAFQSVEVDYPTAIAYLRREAITLPGHTPRGFTLLTYANSPLGFVKNLGSRANNLYPQPWRILSSHIPTTPPTILST